MADRSVGLEIVIRAVAQGVDTALKGVRVAIEGIETGARQAGNEASKLGQKIRAGAREGTRELASVAKQMEMASSSAVMVGGALLGTGTALAAPFILASKEAGNFEAAMNRVQAISNANAGEFTRLSDTAKQLGASTEFTAVQAAEAMTFLAMTGYSTEQSLAAIGSTLNLATASGMDLATTADYLTNILQGFGLRAEDAARGADVLAKTATSSNTNVSELAEAMKYLAPVAASAQVSLEEAAAFIGVLGDNGIKASMAGTGMRRMLVRLLKPTAEAAATLQQVGVEIAKTAEGNIDLVETFRRLKNSTAETKDIIAIFGTHGSSVAEALKRDIDKVEDLIQANNQAEGSLNKMAETMRKGLNKQVVLLGSALSALANAMGAPLLSSLTSLIGKITEVVQVFAVWAAEHPKIAAAMGIVTAAIGLLLGAGGGLLLLFGSLGFLIPAAVKAWGMLSVVKTQVTGAITRSTVALSAETSAINAQTASLGRLAIATKTAATSGAGTAAAGGGLLAGGILATVGAVAAAFVGVGAAVYQIYQHWDTLSWGIKDTLGPVYDIGAAIAKWSNPLGWIYMAWQKIRGEQEAVLSDADAYKETLRDSARRAVASHRNTQDALAAMLKTYENAFGKMTKGNRKKITDAIWAAVKEANAASKKTRENFEQIGKIAGDGIEETFGNSVKTVVNEMKELKKESSSAFETIEQKAGNPAYLKTFQDVARTTINGVQSLIQTTETLLDSGKDVTKGFEKSLQDAAQGGVQSLEELRRRGAVALKDLGGQIAQMDEKIQSAQQRGEADQKSAEEQVEGAIRQVRRRGMTPEEQAVETQDFLLAKIREVQQLREQGGGEALEQAQGNLDTLISEAQNLPDPNQAIYLMQAALNERRQISEELTQIEIDGLQKQKAELEKLKTSWASIQAKIDTTELDAVIARLKETQTMQVNVEYKATGDIPGNTKMRGEAPGGEGMARGGFVRGSGRRDTVPAWLTPGEFVVRADAVRKYGEEIFKALNAMRFNAGGLVPQFSMGGVATGIPLPAGYENYAEWGKAFREMTRRTLARGARDSANELRDVSMGAQGIASSREGEGATENDVKMGSLVTINKDMLDEMRRSRKERIDIYVHQDRSVTVVGGGSTYKD